MFEIEMKNNFTQFLVAELLQLPINRYMNLLKDEFEENFTFNQGLDNSNFYYCLPLKIVENCGSVLALLSTRNFLSLKLNAKICFKL